MNIIFLILIVRVLQCIAINVYSNQNAWCTNMQITVYKDLLLFNRVLFYSLEWTQSVVTSVMSLAVLCPTMSSPQTQQLLLPGANAKQRLPFGMEQSWEHSITVFEYVIWCSQLNDTISRNAPRETSWYRSICATRGRGDRTNTRKIQQLRTPERRGVITIHMVYLYMYISV